MSEPSERTGCLGIFLEIFRLGGGGGKAKERGVISYPYGMRDEFLSAAEISFFHVVKGGLGARYHVIAKVRLVDLFFVRKPNVNRAAFNRIVGKHVDFVVCESGSMRPLLGIELDDSSHATISARESDDLKDRAFSAAGLPLLRVVAARTYHPGEIMAKMEAHLGNLAR